MRGYIREYREGKFSYTVDVGKVNGKRKKIERGGFTTKAEAERALSIKLAELATTGEIFIPTEKTVEEVYNDFMLTAAITRRPSTMRKHSNIFRNHIMPAIGHRFIKTIKVADIDNFLALKMSKGYAVNYVKSMNRTLFAIFDYAYKKGEIKENVMKNSVMIKEPKTKVEIFTNKEITTILETLKGTNSSCIISVVIGLYTGMRKSEILGLRWSDISFTKNTITINKQLVYEKGGYVIDVPKTENSTRVIKMSAHLREYLLELKKLQEKNKELAGEFWQDNTIYNRTNNKKELVTDCVNVTQTGHALNGESIKYVTKLLKPHGIDFKFHKLRHTHATQLLENGATIKMVQERLGHASPQVTLETYSHVTPVHEINIIDTIPAYMSDKSVRQ